MESLSITYPWTPKRQLPSDFYKNPSNLLTLRLLFYMCFLTPYGNVLHVSSSIFPFPPPNYFQHLPCWSFWNQHQHYEHPSIKGYFSSVQLLSCVWLFVTPWIAACQASLSSTISWSLLKLTSIESVMPSSHPILCHPLLLLPPIPPGIRVFSNESALRMRWPEYWSFIFSIIPSKEIPGLISFRMDWLDLLAVQGTLKSLLQHHSSKVSILRH